MARVIPRPRGIVVSPVVVAGSGVVAAGSTWNTVPSVSFTQGVASSWSFAAYAPPSAANFIIGTSGSPNTLNTGKIAELAARGITLDSAAKSLVYNGVGTAGSVNGVILEDTTSVDADWLARSTGSGVVWAVDFGESPDALEKFILRSPGTPANWVRLDPTGGVRGGNGMYWYCGAGSSNGHKWPRPFSPFPASSGSWGSLPADIGYTRGIGGNSGGVQWPYSGEAPNATNYMRWRYGLHGHSDYWSTTREWASSTPWEWVQKSGSATRDFYLQLRTKLSPALFDINNQIVNQHRGKHFYIDLCGGGAGEFVSFAPAEDTSGSYVSHRSRFYTYFNGFDLEAMRNSNYVQPGSPWAATCVANQAVANNCWQMPEGEWFTLLVHVIPGRQNTNMAASQYNPWLPYPNATYRDTQIEVWAHKKGESGYTLIHRRLESSPGANDAYAWYYSATAESNYSSSYGPLGFNEFEINMYMGSSNSPSELAWDRWYDQIIFSHEFIPCPNDGEG